MYIPANLPKNFKNVSTLIIYLHNHFSHPKWNIKLVRTHSQNRPIICLKWYKEMYFRKKLLGLHMISVINCSINTVSLCAKGIKSQLLWIHFMLYQVLNFFVDTWKLIKGLFQNFNASRLNTQITYTRSLRYTGYCIINVNPII